jgi:hypothetical protein
MTEPQRIELQKTEPQRIEPQKSEVGVSEDRQGMTLRLGSGQAEDGRQPPSLTDYARPLKLRRVKKLGAPRMTDDGRRVADGRSCHYSSSQMNSK